MRSGRSPGSTSFTATGCSPRPSRHGAGAEAPRWYVHRVLKIRLDHVVIHVSDWERSNAFYRDVLGAELIDKGDGGPTRHYRLGDQQLNVHGPGMDPHPVAAKPVMPGNSDLCFVWDGPIDAAQDHLKEHGVEIEDGPVTRYGGRGEGTSVYFRDPDGSLLEFISYER